MNKALCKIIIFLLHKDCIYKYDTHIALLISCQKKAKLKILSCIYNSIFIIEKDKNVIIDYL